MNKVFKNSLGLAQIPLMIVLLLMAIAVPVATKLVQNNADNRNMAYDKNAKTFEECLSTGGQQACRAAFPEKQTVVRVNPEIKTGSGLPANGICTKDSQCSGQCPYCGNGRCISGCYGVPTFGYTVPVPTSDSSLCASLSCPAGQKKVLITEGGSCQCISIVPSRGVGSTITTTTIISGRLNPGSKCIFDTDCSSNICDKSIYSNDICIASETNVIDNGFCTKNSNCKSGVCRFDHCLGSSKLNAGSRCMSDTECSSGVCDKSIFSDDICVTSDTNVADNGFCTRDAQCKSGNCRFDHCLGSSKLNAGSRCVSDTECSSGICDKTLYGDDICVKSDTDVEDNGFCTRDAQCKSGNCRFDHCLGVDSTVVTSVDVITGSGGISRSITHSECMRASNNDETLCKKLVSANVADSGIPSTITQSECMRASNNDETLCNKLLPKDLSDSDSLINKRNTLISKNSVELENKLGTGSNSSKCNEQCPGSDGVLRNCTPPESDGSSRDSLCNKINRYETCGTKCFVCTKPGGKWTKEADISKCETANPSGTSSKNPVLNYKISFGGVVPTSAQCAVKWPLQFIVLAAGESKVYSNVIPTSSATVGTKLVFSGSLTLTGFTKLSGVAVFIKGPKHLQVKYGINNQAAMYNKAGGEITLANVVSTSPIYDFSLYPLIPGDVIGTNSEVQDGVINGVDYAYIKSKSILHETVVDGSLLKSDLDGNCQANSNDINLLKISLQDKQGQLY